MTGTGQTGFCPSIQDAHTVHQPKDRSQPPALRPHCLVQGDSPPGPVFPDTGGLEEGPRLTLLWGGGGAGTSKRMLIELFPVISHVCLGHKAKANGVTWSPFLRQLFLHGGQTLPPWLTKTRPTDSAVYLTGTPALPHRLRSRERRKVHHFSPRQISLLG